ncbi:hypothetical protein RMATCC62417_02737 [Rhizopus microsporus]|nr:hypothetical protein RMATCC62417_02737 [Rhizopus microsporus]
MLCTKADNDEGAIRQLEVVEFVFSCSSNSYIYRLRNAKTAEFTGDEALLGEEYSKLFKLIWRAKEIIAKQANWLACLEG